MKQIIFITREGYNLSGARVRCYNFARELNRYGIDAKVFSFADILGAKYGEQELVMSAGEKLKLIYNAFKELISENKEAIFYVHRFNYHTFAPWLISLLKKNRVIFDMDDWDMRENPVYYFGFYPSSKAEYLTRIIARRSIACIAASKYLFQYLRQFNKKIYYLPTGVDSERFNPILNKQNNGKVILSWIGTIYHQEMFENVAFILDCFSQLANRYSHIKLEIAAGGRYLKSAREKANSANLNGKIMISDWIAPDSIPHYLSAINIGLYPLIQNTRFHIAKSPTKLFEYMAMAKPTVCSRLGEAEEVIQDGENGFLAGTKGEFMQKMQRLIEDSSLREKMGQEARRVAEEKYSLKVLGKQLYHIIEEL